MTPVIPCSASNLAFVPRNTFTIRKSKCVGRSSSLEKSIKQTSSSQKFLLHFPANLRLLPKCHTLRLHRLSATGIDAEVATEVSPVQQEDSAVSPEEDLTVKSDASSSPARSTRTRPPRKSDVPPVKKEDVIPGATFTGKVRSIQPFGAFVDFGAFTDGLVHVSRVSNTFVKDVASVLSVGQEVTVRVVEVNPDSGRIALSMRDNDDKDSGSGDKGRPPRKINQKKFETKKASKFVKGQELVGTVKNLTRSGAFIALPEGEEGFLPQSEEADDGIPNLTGSSTLEVGQEINVRVLRIARGQLTLTMKKEEDFQKMDSELNNGVVHLATNPFVLAFRQNKDISTFLDDREKLGEAAQASESKVEVENETEDSVTESVSSLEEVSTSQTEEDANTEVAETVAESTGEISVGQTEDLIENDEVAADESGDAVEDVPAVESSIEEVEVATPETDVPDATSSGEVDTEQTSAVENALDLSPSAEEQSVTPVLEQTDPATSENAALPIETSSSAEEQSVTPLVEQIDPPTSSEDAAKPIETSSSSSISPAMVKQLRDETGAGMMDCKRALSETEGDVVKALEYLRKKGLASAEKKAGRATAEGRIGSYIHDSRIGVLVEVNCETDFVSRGDIFKELVDDLAMQVAACPQVVCLVPEDIPKETIEKEREIEMQKEDLLSKPEQMRSRIVDGRIKKRLDEMALLEQPYIKNDKILIKDWVKQTIATIGENIKVKRFVRYNLGEGLEKKSQDFAAEVAAQTAARSSPKEPVAAAAAAAEPDKAAESAPAVAISAALVKQLREESGAGMMDCKKALSETGGDLEKAQEYLRKKGLSAADKKSSRLAAEGRIGSYIHDSRIGVLIEVNCETDFVGRSERFKELVDDLAMQVVACPQVQFVSMDDISKDTIEKEKAIEMQREDLVSKPEGIREKIVEGRVSKRLGELALLEQPFVKDDAVLVKDLVKQTVAALGENIRVRRFTRFTLGENIVTEPEPAVEA